jgi:hypothetical protein
MASAAPAVFLKHIGGHCVLEAPDHLDWSLGLETDDLRGTKKRERYGDSVSFLP